MDEMSTHSDHICEEKPGKKRKISSIRKYRKGCNNSSLFTCGGCHTKFRTICCLHIHLDRHQEGGSYTYDHVTKTAFPKFDSVCAYTQVEQRIFELITHTSDGVDKPCKGIQTFSKEEGTESIEVIRKSKRIAKRKDNRNHVIANVDRMDTKLNKSNISAISEVEKGVKNKQVHILVSAPISKASARLERANQFRKTNTVEYNTCFKKLKRTKLESDMNKLSSDSEPSNIDQDKGNLSKLDGGKRKVDFVDDTTKMRLDNLKSINQKTDEIAASEALIAIGKSVDGENAQNCNDSDKHTPHNETFEISDVILDITSIKSENKEDICGTDQSNVPAARPDTCIDEQKSRQDTDDQGKEITNTPLATDKGKHLESIDKEFSQRGQVTEISQKGTHHPSDDKETCEKQEKWACPTCGKLGSRGMLSYHKHLHKKEKELSCDKCGKQFQHPTCLKVHLRSHDEKTFKCEKCPANFSRKKYLETHMLKHSGEKPYMCETCGKAYRDEMHLKRHIKHVHDQIRNFECDICKERFFRADHLKCHRLRHFEPGFRCDFCNKKFKVSLDLDRHVRIHTGDKKWFCHICSHGFRYPVPYYNHMRKQHDIERSEAEIWRKKLIEENRKKRKSEDYMTEGAIVGLDYGNYISQNAGNQSTPDSKVAISMDISIRGNVEPDVPAVGKLYIKNEGIIPRNRASSKVDTLNIVGKPYHVNVRNKDVRNISQYLTRSSVVQASGMHLQQDTNEYGIISLADRTTGKSVQVVSNLAQEQMSLQQSLHFPLQDSFSEEENTATREDGMVGYENGDQLQDEEIVVMGEETVVEDINVMSEIEGESTQAVMFIDDNECVGEVVIDQETTI